MKISRKAQVLIAITALGLVATQTTATYAATKKITCYKGTTSKVVTGTNPKCPAGYTTTKPATAPAKTTSAAPAASAKTVAFSGKYVGKMSLVWSDSGVSASAVNATGSGNNSGLDALIGTGSSSPASKCDGIDGSGSLGGGGNTITVKFDTSTKGCADSDAAPTTVKDRKTTLFRSLHHLQSAMELMALDHSAVAETPSRLSLILPQRVAPIQMLRQQQ